MGYLWCECEDIYRSRIPKPQEVWCQKCVHNDCIKWIGNTVPALTIGTTSVEAKEAAVVFKDSGHNQFVFELDKKGGQQIPVEVLDNLNTKLIDKVGPCQMQSVTVDYIIHVLSRLRRQRINGIMSGLICLRFQDYVQSGNRNKFHTMNFILGPGPSR